MSVNVMQRIPVSKKENLVFRNCLIKSVSNKDQSAFTSKKEGTTSSLYNTNKNFIAPVPLSKSTTYEKKYKSIFAQREAEYDKNLKSIKVNLFTSVYSSTNFPSRATGRSVNPSDRFRSSVGGVNRPLSVSTNFAFMKRDRSRTRVNPNVSIQKSNATEDSRIIERSEESHKVSNWGYEEAKKKETTQYNQFMRKEEEIEIDLTSLNKLIKNDEKNIEKDENKVQLDELDLLNDKDDSKLLEIYMKDDLIFNSEMSSETCTNTQKKEDHINFSNPTHTEERLNSDYRINLNKEFFSKNESMVQKINSKEKEQNTVQIYGNSKESNNFNFSNLSNFNNLNNFNSLNNFSNFNNPPLPRYESLNSTLETYNYFQDKLKKINLGIFTLNYENLKTNKESKTKFSKEEYRKLLDTVLRFEYGTNILEDFYREEETNEKFLEKHQITERMRMKMVDWMIEVVNNYKCEDNTYFLAVNILDRFFKLTETILKPEDLHLLGICAMFIASKFHDVYPMKLKLIVEKIGHNKFSAEEIKAMEEKIIKTLNYELLKPTSFDFVNFYYEEIFFSIENNFTIEDEILSRYLESFFSTFKIRFDFNYEKYRGGKKFTSKMLNLLKNVVIYLAKMNLHDYSLIAVKPSLLAAASILVGVKICEQINNENYINDYLTKKICEMTRSNEYDLLYYSQKILFNAQNFESLFIGLENLKKVHFNYILSLKETN